MDSDLQQKLDSISTELKGLKSKMDSAPNSVWGATFVIAILLALISNPSRGTHAAHIAGRLAAENSSAGKIVSGIAQPVIDQLITYESYWLWSLGKVTIDGKTQNLTFGIFGNIFDQNSPDDLKKKFN
jgi:hypothetical protein